MNLKTKISAAALRYAEQHEWGGMIRQRTDAFKAGSNFAIGEVRELLREVKDHFAFTLGCTNNLLRPDRPVHDGLDPTFYHTLTAEGDKDLIRKALAAADALKKIDDSGVLTDEMGD
jgi:hypothetical protein